MRTDGCAHPCRRVRLSAILLATLNWTVVSLHDPFGWTCGGTRPRDAYFFRCELLKPDCVHCSAPSGRMPMTNLKMGMSRRAEEKLIRSGSISFAEAHRALSL